MNFKTTLFILAATLFMSVSAIAQNDSTNDDWSNSASPPSATAENQLNRTAITTTEEAAGKITFGNGSGSILTHGLRVESVPVTGSTGAQIGLRTQTSANVTVAGQAGNAEGRLGQSSAYYAGGSFIGVYGIGRSSALNTFDPTVGFSWSTGGLFSGGTDVGGTALNIAGDKAYVGGTYSELVGAIDGVPAEGAAAAVIGIDKNTGTTPSYASYFEGNQNYMSGKLGIGTPTPASTLSVGGDGSDQWAGYFFQDARVSGDNALRAEMPRPISFAGSFRAINGIIESGYGYAIGVNGSSYTATPQSNGRSYGVYAQAGNATARANFGLFSRLRGQNSGAAVLGWDEVNHAGWGGVLPTNDSWAGYFIGDVNVTESLGVGVSAPTQALDVSGNGNIRGNFLNVGQDAGATAAYLRIGAGRTADGIAAIDCIGTTAYPLYGFRFGYTGAGSSIMFHRGTNPFLIQATEAADVYIRTNSANRMVVKDNGKVGIGTTSPGACGSLLDVNGGIAYNGTLCNTSDKRLKKDAKDFDYGLNEVLALSPIYYNYNGKAGTDSEQTHVGIYAQDLKEVAPKLVGEFKYEETEIEITEDGQEVDVKTNVKKSPETYLNINESSIKYMLINAVKEQQDVIEMQADKIQQQDEEMADLKDRLSKIEAMLNNPTSTINMGTPTTQTVELSNTSELFQNQPNPFTATTRIKYTLSDDVQNAVMQITDANGKIIKTVQLEKVKNGEVIIKAQELSAGTYFYTLIADGQLLGTKKMILTK